MRLLLRRLICLGRIAGISMWARKLHIAMLLGAMAVGALALAATLFLGEGATRTVWRDLDRLLGSRLVVHPALGPDDVLLRRRSSAALTPADLQFLRTEIPAARYVGTQLSIRTSVRSRHHPSAVLFVDGISEEIEGEELYGPLAGSGFSPAARQGMARECLLTRSAAAALVPSFPDEVTIEVHAETFRVVGIISDPPDADRPYVERIIVPFALARSLWGEAGDVGAIVVGWHDATAMQEVVEGVRHALDRVRAPNAYILSTSDFAIKTRRAIVSNLLVLGAAQASFCLAVAAVAIFTAMSGSVHRRAREFAVRMVMGATPGDVAFVVLLESLTIAVGGGVLGIVGAVGLAGPLATALAANVSQAAGLRPAFTVTGMVLPLATSCVCGLLAGALPAMQACRLDILAVLRTE